MIKRIITGVAVACFWVGVLRYLPGWALFVVLQLFSALTLYEFYRLCERGGLAVSKTLGILGGVVWIGALFALPLHVEHGLPRNFPHECLLLALMFFGLLSWLLLNPKARDPLRNAAVTALGFCYLPFMLSFFLRLAQWGSTGPFEITRAGVVLVFYTALVLKMCDAGAYACGLAFGRHGRHRMFPRVSPKKSWEGFWGGMVVAVASSVGAVAVARNLSPIPAGPLAQVSLWHAVTLGLVLGVVGVLGDLIESLFKRTVDVKDSGGYLPGIGGVLDVFDSLVFAPAVVFFYVSWFHA
jgi:phosphatidate cytidylyltransferase